MIPYGRHSIDDDDIAAVAGVLRSDWLTTGPAVAGFEKALADYLGVPHAVAVNTGTAALHAAMAVLGIGPEDEVIVPCLTFVATANAAVFQGARPVFADIDPATLLVDPADVARRITASHAHPPKLVALTGYGQPGDRAETAKAGFHAHLVKPLGMDALQNLLSDLFGTGDDAGAVRD